MNLIIKQNNQVTEYVSSELIDILYNLAKSNILGGSNENVTQLQGRVEANIAYDDAITFLNENFGPDFIVSANSSYVRIEDPAVFEVLMQRLQNDGIGIQMAAFNTNLPEAWFKNNTAVRTFNETKYFTKGDVNLNGLTNLTSIDLSKNTYTTLKNLPNLIKFNGTDSTPGHAKISRGLGGGDNVPNLTVLEINDDMPLDELKATNVFRSFNYINTLIMTPMAGLKIGWYAFTEKTYKKQIKIKNLKNYIQCNFEHAGFFVGNTTSELLLNDELVTDVTIPNDVNIVGNGIFENYKYLTSVTLHSGITAIKMYAFRNATNAVIADIDCPYLTELGEEAFKGTKLQRITNLGQILEIKKNTFADCTSLTDITFPGTINSVGENAFNNTAWLNGKNNTVIYIDNVLYKCKGTIDSTLVIPNNVVQIVPNAFKGITSLESLTIGISVNSIGLGEGIFYGCTNLATIVVDSNNAKYDSRDNCNAIIETATNKLIAACKSTTIPNSVTSIGGSAFADCSGLTSLTIPGSVQSIGTYAFKNCSSVTSLTINEGVKTIGLDSFQGNSITNIVFPNSLKTIQQGAFWNSPLLQTVEIGTDITTIGPSAFNNCPHLISITIKSTNPSGISIGNDVSFGSTSCPIYVPASSVEAYKSASGWSNFASRIQAIPT